MKKLRNRIFIRLQFAIVLILGVSMLLNIKAQRNLYIDYARESFMGYEQGKEIVNLLGVGDTKDRLSYDETIDRLHEFNVREKIDIHKWTTRNILVFLKEEPVKQSEIIDYSFHSLYQDNYIYLMTQELGYKPFSIEHFPFEVRETLLSYLKNNMNKNDEYGSIQIYVDYCLNDNELVYLKWDNEEFGTITGEVNKTYLNNYCINGNLYWYDILRDEYMIINVEELFKVITTISSSTAIGYGGAGIEEIKYNGDLYFIADVYIGGDISEYYNVVNCSLVNVVQDFDSFVLQKYFEQNMWLYISSFILLVFVSYSISGMLSKPIKQLEQTALKISNNDFNEEIKIKSKDEIGSLANSINIMRLKLKENIDNLNLEIEKVKELESLRKDFINQFTHEMKTPLGIINGYSELLEETDNEEERQRYIDIINKETVRINDLVQGMLKLSRLEAGKVELTKEELDLEDIVTEVIDEFEVLLMKKNIKVEVNIADKHVVGDQQQLMTVIRNFISNAIKHTDTKIVVTIDTGVKVFNEGLPIDKDKLEGIWYTFVTHDKTGTGLGLAICRSILELHHYQYGVENKENGVEFYFFE